MREAVAAGRGLGGQVVELRLPAGAAGAVVRYLCADQRREQSYVYVVQLAPHQPYDIRRLPAAPPGRRHELLAAPGEFGVRPAVGREQGGARVEGAVLGVVEGRLEGAVDGAGRTHQGIVSRLRQAGEDRCQPRVDTPGVSTYG